MKIFTLKMSELTINKADNSKIVMFFLQNLGIIFGLGKFEKKCSINILRNKFNFKNFFSKKELCYQ
jgi:hypothetical protein